MRITQQFQAQGFKVLGGAMSCTNAISTLLSNHNINKCCSMAHIETLRITMSFKVWRKVERKE